MSAPTKPWEGSSLNSSAGPILPNFDNVSGGIRPSIVSTTTPALPPTLNPRLVANIRQPATQGYSSQGYSSYGGYSSMPYSSFGGGGYGGYSSGYGGYNSGYGSYGGGYGASYSGYGGFGSPYGSGYGYGMQQPGVENRFIQLAEESARPTFQTIESVVRTFSSMGAMLDQTFFAMTSSFRAILSVADSFGRLRSMMGQMWTSFALFKAINWLLRKLMSILRLYDASKDNVLNEAFSSAATSGGEALIEAAATPSRWPIAVFLGVIISAPYIVSKLFAQNLNEAAVNEEENLQFRNVPATYSFTANNSHELSFQAGEWLRIYPDEIQQKNGLIRTGWVLAKNKQGVKGVIPINYLFENKTVSSTS